MNETKIPNYAKQTMKSLRARAGMTQEEASLALGVSKKTLKNWESNSSKMNFEDMVKASQLYSCPMSYIFFGDSNAFSVRLLNEKEFQWN